MFNLSSILTTLGDSYYSYSYFTDEEPRFRE